jgi:hypothetical protein
VPENNGNNTDSAQQWLTAFSWVLQITVTAVLALIAWTFSNLSTQVLEIDRTVDGLKLDQREMMTELRNMTKEIDRNASVIEILKGSIRNPVSVPQLPNSAQ